MSPREWNATAYDELPLPHVQWGLRTIERLQLTGSERVLDAGCGTGRDAEALLNQYPEVDLVGVDGSHQMVAAARARMGDRAVIAAADLTRPLHFAGFPAADSAAAPQDHTSRADAQNGNRENTGTPADQNDGRDNGNPDVLARGSRPGRFDRVMSVACFHWISDHESLFANLAELLRPGGQLVSDSGGEGNINIVESAVSAVQGVAWHPKSFASPVDTRRRLAVNGFDPVRVELRPSPFRIDDPQIMEHYLATICLGAHLEQLSEADGAEFTRQVRLAMREPVLDYVRLEIDAVRR